MIGIIGIYFFNFWFFSWNIDGKRSQFVDLTFDIVSYFHVIINFVLLVCFYSVLFSLVTVFSTVAQFAISSSLRFAYFQQNKTWVIKSYSNWYR